MAGLSMGGYGALKWALRQPERFAAAASLSGALDLAGLRTQRVRPEDPRLFDRVFGDRAAAGGPDDLHWLLEPGGPGDAAAPLPLLRHRGPADRRQPGLRRPRPDRRHRRDDRLRPGRARLGLLGRHDPGRAGLAAPRLGPRWTGLAKLVDGGHPVAVGLAPELERLEDGESGGVDRRRVRADLQRSEVPSPIEQCRNGAPADASAPRGPDQPDAGLQRPRVRGCASVAPRRRRPRAPRPPRWPRRAARRGRAAGPGGTGGATRCARVPSGPRAVAVG